MSTEQVLIFIWVLFPQQVSIQRVSVSSISKFQRVSVSSISKFQKVSFQIFIRAPDEGAVQIASFPEQDLSDDVTVSDISNSLIYVIPDTQPQNHGM